MTRNVKTIHGHQATGNCGPTEGVRKCTLLGVNASSRFGLYILRLAAVLLLMVVGVSEIWGQHPFTLTTADDITGGTQKYYLIQSIDRSSFYAIPHSNADGAKVSTTSIPNADMRWCFVDAGSDSDHQYYYEHNQSWLPLLHCGNTPYCHVDKNRACRYLWRMTKNT